MYGTDDANHPTILLASGRYFDFSDPQPLTIGEVAHALSHLCRFTGHCARFYSVAQHSVHVSFLVPYRFALWGLLHDAVEAVVGDMASPVKRMFPEYKALEDRCERVILAGFGLDVDAKPPEVKVADRIALRTEQRDLMRREGGLWTSLAGVEPDPRPIHAFSSEVAHGMFMRRFAQLMPAANDGGTAKVAA